MNSDETVFIVDSDAESRRRVCTLVKSMKLRHETYTLGQDFLDQYNAHRPGCVILEIRIADTNGLQLQEQLTQRQPAPSIIFLAAHASVPIVVRAMQQGAVNFLQKPADEQELWDSIQRALRVDRERRSELAEIEGLEKQLGLLSSKELEVLELIAQHKTTRSIADELNLSVRTVEFRRARMLEKLDLKTPIELFHFAFRLVNRFGHDGNSRNDGRGNSVVAKSGMFAGK